METNNFQSVVNAVPVKTSSQVQNGLYFAEDVSPLILFGKTYFGGTF